MTDRPPAVGTVLWSVTAFDLPGDQGLQLGVKHLDGEQIAYFVFDHDDAQQQNLPGTASVNGSVLTAAFPHDALQALGQRWKWHAVMTVEGNDVDRCPNEGSDPMKPRTLTFPG